MFRKLLAICGIGMLLLSSGCANSSSSPFLNRGSCAVCNYPIFDDTYSFCPSCGNNWRKSSNVDDSDHTPPTPAVSYEEFGFSNMYDLHEWIEIDHYNFGTAFHPYISIFGFYGTARYGVINFENGFYERRDFEERQSTLEEISFRGDRSVGELSDLLKYQTVNNHMITIPRELKYDIVMEITNIDLSYSIPIITVLQTIGDNSYEYTYIPTNFIDFSQKPETIVVDSEGFMIEYYIDTQYIHPSN